jgi:hypothetical protein
MKVFKSSPRVLFIIIICCLLTILSSRLCINYLIENDITSAKGELIYAILYILNFILIFIIALCIITLLFSFIKKKS